MSRLGVFQVVSFFLYVLFQVLILKNAVLFHTAFCFLYLAFLLSLPVEFDRLLLIFVGFLLGIAVDIFYDSLGLHALACVFVGFVRNRWLSVLTPQGGYNTNSVPALAEFGGQWFITYSLPLIVVHHALLFYVEAGGFDYFWHTLGKVAASALYTLLVILIIEFVFPRKQV